MATVQTAGSITAGSNTTAGSLEAARARKETFDFASDYISILHAGEQNPLGGWDKQVRLGSIKRRTEDSLGPGQRTFHAIEIAGSNSYSTYIVSPKVPFAELNIHLPNLVLVCKNTGRNFTFEVQIEDDRGSRHRFNFSNSNLQVPRRTPFLTFIPLRFQDGWNDVCIDLAHLTEKVYGLKFVKVLRVKIFANIRLQQVFFVNDAIWTGQTPVPALKMMNNVHMIPTTHLPMVNPLWRETGPEQRQIPQVPDPLDHSRVTRVEAELSRRGARVISLPPTPPISSPKNTVTSSPSFSSKSKPSSSRSFQRAALLRSRSKSPAAGTSDSSNSFKNQLLKVNMPEADEAMKLLNVVKNMHLNPNDDPTVYVAALKKLRQAETHSKRAYKRVTNIGSSKSTPQNVETSGFTANLGGAASQLHSNDSKSASKNTNVATTSKSVSGSGKSPSRISNSSKTTNSEKPAKLIQPVKDSESAPPNVNAASTSTNISASEKSSSGVAKSKTKHSVGTSTEFD